VVEVAEGFAAQRWAGAAVAGAVDVTALEAWSFLSFGHGCPLVLLQNLQMIEVSGGPWWRVTRKD
jgi:hypothetical protein